MCSAPHDFPASPSQPHRQRRVMDLSPFPVDVWILILRCCGLRRLLAFRIVSNTIAIYTITESHCGHGFQVNRGLCAIVTYTPSILYRIHAFYLGYEPQNEPVASAGLRSWGAMYDALCAQETAWAQASFVLAGTRSLPGLEIVRPADSGGSSMPRVWGNLFLWRVGFQVHYMNIESHAYGQFALTGVMMGCPRRVTIAVQDDKLVCATPNATPNANDTSVRSPIAASKKRLTYAAVIVSCVFISRSSR